MAKLSTIGLFVTLLCLTSVTGYGPEMSCKDFVAMMTKAQMTGIKECTKSLKLTGKEKSTKMNCIIKCIMSKEGLLNSEGVYNKDDADKMMDKMPINLAEKGAPAMKKCGEDSVGVLDPTDPFCKSYGTLVTCLMGVMTKLCKEVS